MTVTEEAFSWSSSIRAITDIAHLLLNLTTNPEARFASDAITRASNAVLAPGPSSRAVRMEIERHAMIALLVDRLAPKAEDPS